MLPRVSFRLSTQPRAERNYLTKPSALSLCGTVCFAESTRASRTPGDAVVDWRPAERAHVGALGTLRLLLNVTMNLSAQLIVWEMTDEVDNGVIRGQGRGESSASWSSAQLTRVLTGHAQRPSYPSGLRMKPFSSWCTPNSVNKSSTLLLESLRIQYVYC